MRFGGGVYSGMVQRTGEGGAWLHHLYQVRCERYNRLQIDHNALVRAPFRRIFEEARQRLKTSEGNQSAGCGTAFAQDMENVAKLVVCQESNVNGESTGNKRTCDGGAELPALPACAPKEKETRSWTCATYCGKMRTMDDIYRLRSEIPNHSIPEGLSLGPWTTHQEGLRAINACTMDPTLEEEHLR
ncbi:MAG: hypothetical protein ACRDQ5_07365 [Sciscionella sp.]